MGASVQRSWVLFRPTFLSARNSCVFVLHDLLLKWTKTHLNWLKLTEIWRRLAKASKRMRENQLKSTKNGPEDFARKLAKQHPREKSSFFRGSNHKIARSESSICADPPFLDLVDFLAFLFFDFPSFFVRFPFFFQGFEGFREEENPRLFGGFPFFFSKKSKGWRVRVSCPRHRFGGKSCVLSSAISNRCA